MSVTELAKIVRPPTKPSEVPSDLGWKEIEKRLGLELPPDYKDFVKTFGSGLLGNYIRVFNPFSKDEYIALIPSVLRICEIRRSLKKTDGDAEVPYLVYPDTPGILPWGNDENGDTYYWLTKKVPSEWPVLVGEGRGRRWEEFPMPMTKFLASCLNRELKCGLWPAKYPRLPKDQVFRSYNIE